MICLLYRKSSLTNSKLWLLPRIERISFDTKCPRTNKTDRKRTEKRTRTDIRGEKNTLHLFDIFYMIGNMRPMSIHVHFASCTRMKH